MSEETIKEKIKGWISGVGWRMFLWGIEKTAEEYWKEIQRQENALDNGGGE